MYKLLIVDDEEAICFSLSFALENEYEVRVANDEEQVLKLVTAEEFDLILLDLRLGKSDGLKVLEKIRKIRPSALVIIMTAYASIESSVAAIRQGAFYYITKPINMDELRLLLEKAINYLSLSSQVEHYKGKSFREYEQAGIIGNSAAVEKTLELIAKVRNTDTNVMITGESGTGKELVARAIHYTGNRKDEPFEAVNCAAIPPGLLESELFGHERGAFTGAINRKRGIFELADKGTLFLDEICEMDINLQSKLLRVVQQKEVTPVGSNVKKKIDARILCATNRNIKEEIAAGRFREDLFYRLNVINIHLAPLRERAQDIPLLADYFIARYSRKIGKTVTDFEQVALEALCRYQFKGNIRELENIIERGIVLANKNYISFEDLPAEVGGAFEPSAEPVPAAAKNMLFLRIGESLAEIEQKVIVETLHFFKGNRRKTAEMLKISERSLRYKLKEYQLEEKKYAEPAIFADNDNK